MKKAVIVSAARTAVGKFAGQWAGTPPEKLAAATMLEAIKRAGVEPSEIEDVIYGNIYGQNGNTARRAALTAGIPLEVSAATIDRQCGSGTQAIVYAALNIMSGNGDIFLAGGVEHMTLMPYQLQKTTQFSPIPPAFLPPKLSIAEIGDPSMPETCEILGEQKGITRADCDEWAAMSHQRAAKAQGEGVFSEQIVPLEITFKKNTITIDQDECVRADTSVEVLAKLPPIAKKDGLVTAGSSSPISDGGASLIVMSEDEAKRRGLKPFASVHSFATVGLDPNIMGYGPVPAVRKVLAKAGLELGDIGTIELNEAFAAQVVPCVRDLELDIEKVNPNGGAIALGHPLAGTGAILTTKALYEMRDKGLQYGMVTMCIGGGQGMAVIYENMAF